MAADGPAVALADLVEIVLPRPQYASIVGHVVRKLTEHYLDGETPETKAFGMVVGRQHGQVIEVTGVVPLLVNLRRDARHVTAMDELVGQHAIPSQTPNERRGWIAHPAELLAIEQLCDDNGWVVFGNYHTHRVPWPHDPRRDSCTELDRHLADGSGQWTFIVSAVDLHAPSLRAFYEGRNDREARVRLTPPAAIS